MCRFKDGIIALITQKNNKSWYIKKFNNFFTMIKKKKKHLWDHHSNDFIKRFLLYIL